MFEEAVNRYGRDFAQYQRNVVTDLFDKHNKGYDERMSFEDIYKIFESIY